MTFDKMRDASFRSQAETHETQRTIRSAARTRRRSLATVGALLFNVLPGAHDFAEANSPPAQTGANEHAPANAPVTLSKSATQKNEIKVVPVVQARLAGDIQLIGNVTYDADHYAMVGPLVAGRVAKLNVTVGSQVRRGQVMAEIESVDVGQSRGDLIAAKARLGAATSNLNRERDLAEKKISSSREREMAESQWASERAAVRAAHEKLRAIGLTDSDIESIEEHGIGGRVRIRAPIDGTVLERKVTLGQAIQPAEDAFKLANLNRVWVQLDLYEKDLARVRVGLAVEVRTDAYPGEVVKGRVAYVSPVIDIATRTAQIRVEIDNRKGRLHIGQLVNAKLFGNPDANATPVLAVPRTSIQRIDGKALVFLKVANGFQRQFVEIGLSGGELIEIRSGLQLGQEVASEGGFLLKSEMLR